jgi:hypothetical protein
MNINTRALIVPPIADAVMERPRALPPSPLLAIGNPSNRVTADEDSPGIRKRIDVMEPPAVDAAYSAPSMLRACIGVIHKVTGIMIAAAAVDPSPGRIPTIMPSITPRIIAKKCIGSATELNPISRLSYIAASP